MSQSVTRNINPPIESSSYNSTMGGRTDSYDVPTMEVSGGDIDIKEFLSAGIEN
jgi:hypothetical protein